MPKCKGEKKTKEIRKKMKNCKQNPHPQKKIRIINRERKRNEKEKNKQKEYLV